MSFIECFLELHPLCPVGRVGIAGVHPDRIDMNRFATNLYRLARVHFAIATEGDPIVFLNILPIVQTTERFWHEET